MKTLNPKNQYTAVIQKADGWWIGWIAEVPGVNCQEKDLETLRASLRIVLADMLEVYRQDALQRAGGDFITETINPAEEFVMSVPVAATG